MYEGNQNALAGPRNGGLANQMQYGGSGPTPIAPRDTIQQALDEQEKHVVELHGALTGLVDRLMVVLAPDMNKIANDSASPPSSGNVIDRVRRHSSAIHGASSRLQDLMQRLQL